jgi:integrase
MANLRKVSGNYYARFYDRDRQPKRKTWPLRTGRQDVARKRLAELEQAYRDGDFDPWGGGYTVEHVSLSDAVERFLDAKGKTVREATIADYKSKLNAWKRDHAPAGIMLRDVAAKHLTAYINALTRQEKPPSNRTQRSRYGVLRTFLLWADDETLLDRNPLDDISKPQTEKKQPAFLSVNELERLLRSIPAHRETLIGQPGPTPDDEWLSAMIRVAVCTGLRRAELRNLRWNDLDLDNGFLHVRNRDDGSFKSKSGSERTVPLRGDGLDRLRQMHAARTDDLDGPVFTDRNGNRVKLDRISKRFKFYVRKAKLKNKERLHFHSLRHTTGSWLAMKGVPMPVISKIMGHSSTAVTEVYANVSKDVTVRAMEEVFGNS